MTVIYLFTIWFLLWPLLCLLASGQSGIVTRIGAAPKTLKSRAAANSIFTSIFHEYS